MNLIKKFFIGDGEISHYEATGGGLLPLVLIAPFMLWGMLIDIGVPTVIAVVLDGPVAVVTVRIIVRSIYYYFHSDGRD